LLLLLNVRLSNLSQSSSRESEQPSNFSTYDIWCAGLSPETVPFIGSILSLIGVCSLTSPLWTIRYRELRRFGLHGWRREQGREWTFYATSTATYSEWTAGASVA
jgi:hypothetical protein